jgi:putative nucleotidyltransferase with HDIG domain
MKKRDIFWPLFTLFVPLVVFEFLRANPSIDIRFIFPRGHFYIVSSVVILATFIAIAVGISGYRLRNSKVIFLSLAFISLAETFAVHGLSTPGLLMHVTHLPGVAAQISILLASIWLWLSSLPSDSYLITKLSGFRGGLIPIWTVSIGLLAVIVILNPHLLDFIPLDQNPVNWIMTVSVISLNLVTVYRYFQSYRYSRFPLQMAIIYSSCLLMVAQYIMVEGVIWQSSWWIYHFLLLVAMLIMLLGLFKQYSANKSLTMAIKALFTTDPLERITSCLSPSVRSLIVATEEKDPYTGGHNFRVTLYAMKLADEMHLSPEQLRSLSQGSIVHDVGKINIPDEILNKPGRLTSEERTIIETHPVIGYEMCRMLGFMKEELSIIRSHHEKWDGTGYPDNLKGVNIPILARIVAVVDVYDALTSHRSYRQAWTHDKAIQLLLENKGTHFDPSCVDAWIRICEENPEVYQYPSSVISELNPGSALNATSSVETVTI